MTTSHAKRLKKQRGKAARRKRRNASVSPINTEYKDPITGNISIINKGEILDAPWKYIRVNVQPKSYVNNGENK